MCAARPVRFQVHIVFQLQFKMWVNVDWSFALGLQVSSHSFNGLSPVDLEVLVKHFVVLKVSQNTSLWDQESIATSFVLMLRGQGIFWCDEPNVTSGVRSREVVGHLREGEHHSRGISNGFD